MRRILLLPHDQRLAAMDQARSRRREVFLASLPTTVDVKNSERLTVRATVGQLRRLALMREVSSVTVVRTQRRAKPTPSWFTVVATIRVDVEGRPVSESSLERRVALVFATNEDAAIQAFRNHYRTVEAMPYLNSDGYAVYWRLVAIASVYDPCVTEIESREIVEVLSEWLS
jgi:hypothetical protein